MLIDLATCTYYVLMYMQDKYTYWSQNIKVSSNLCMSVPIKKKSEIIIEVLMTFLTNLKLMKTS